MLFDYFGTGLAVLAIALIIAALTQARHRANTLKHRGRVTF